MKVRGVLDTSITSYRDRSRRMGHEVNTYFPAREIVEFGLRMWSIIQVMADFKTDHIIVPTFRKAPYELYRSYALLANTGMKDQTH